MFHALLICISYTESCLWSFYLLDCYLKNNNLTFAKAITAPLPVRFIMPLFFLPDFNTSCAYLASIQELLNKFLPFKVKGAFM